jgi:hypothetical protein
MLTLATPGTSDKGIAKKFIPSSSGRLQSELIRGTYILLDPVTAMADCAVRESTRSLPSGRWRIWICITKRSF